MRSSYLTTITENLFIKEVVSREHEQVILPTQKKKKKVDNSKIVASAILVPGNIEEMLYSP